MDKVLNFRTVNKPKYFNFEWVIENFLKIPREVESTFCLLDSNGWRVKAELNSDRNECKVSLICKDLAENIWITHETALKNYTKNVLSESKTDHIYKGNDEYLLLTAPVSVELLTEGILVIEVYMAVYGLMLSTFVENQKEVPNGITGKEKEDLAYDRNKVKEDSSSDCSIKVKDQVFQAHRVMLKFRANKFYQSHSEKLRRGVLALDIEPNMFEIFLNYVYSGVLPNEWVMALHGDTLYPFANKCGVKELMMHCSRELAHNLNIQNAVKTLQMAVQDDDEMLKSKAVSFIKNNIKSIRGTPEWKDMLETFQATGKSYVIEEIEK